MRTHRPAAFAWRAALLLVIVVSSAVYATAPSTMSYQGYLEENDQPVNGGRNLRFVLYGSPTSSDSLWSEGHAGVAVDRGVFSVRLGAANPLTGQLLQRAQIYLETRVDGVPLAPRRRLDSVPYALISAMADSAGYATQAQSALHATTAETATYALHAAYADSAGNMGGGGGDTYWGPQGTNIYSLNPGAVGIGTTSPTRKLHVIDSSTNPAVAVRNNGSGNGLEVVATAGAGIGLKASAAGKGVEGWASGTGGTGVYGGADAGSGPTTGVFGYASSPNARGVYGTVESASGTSYGVLGEVGSSSVYGVGGRNLDATGAGVGVYGYSAATSGHGVRGEAVGTLSKGVSGSSPETGVYGVASGSNGRGVHGVANSANAYGIFGSSTSTSGTGVYGTGGLYGGRFVTTASGSDRYAVLAEATATGARAVQAVASGSSAVALYAEASNPASQTGAAGHFVGRGGGGVGVIGEATNTGTGSNHGGYFVSAGSSASGVVGINTSYQSDAPGVLGEHRESDNWGVGVRGNGNYRGVEGFAYGQTFSGPRTGVYGSAAGGTAPGTNYGVYGTASGSGTNYAGYFAGNTHVTGTLSKGGGSFKIDHPLDPANKYLFHSFVESPDMMNVYNGNVVLDADGAAVVDLPEWFDALNRDFRYQLTCIGGFAPVYVAEKVQGNRFRIAGGAPGLEVSWQVTGIRQDAFANAHRIPVELDKPADERGTYLHAIELGMPGNRQMDRARERPDLQPGPSRLSDSREEAGAIEQP